MDVPVREDGASDDKVILFTEVNDCFSIVCEVTYFMLSHNSFRVLVAVSNSCIKVSKQEQDVVERRQLSSAASSRNHPCPHHLSFQLGA